MSEKKSDLSRRDFVKTGALATATVTGFNVLASKEARAQAPITVGLVGCGGRGRGAAENAMRAAGNVTVVAMADLFEDRLNKTREYLSEKLDHEVSQDKCFLGWDAYKKIIAQDVDYVILATPPVFRPLMLKAAVEAGKNVFMEKPAAVDPPGIREIMAAGRQAKAKGLSIVAGTQRRHQKPYVETIKRIHDGACGDIVAARAYWCGGPIGYRPKTEGMSDMEYQIRSWYHFLWLSGDHIVEQHVHNLDVINWIMGKHPVRAFGCGGRAWQGKGNIWDHHAVDYEFDNGVHLSSMCRQLEAPDHNVSEFVVGTKNSSNCSDWIGGRGKEWKFEGDYTDAYIQEHTDLIAGIREGKPLNEAQNVAESTMTAILGRMAEYSGKILTWDEALASNESLGLDNYELGPVKLKPVAIPGGTKFTGKEGWSPG